MKYFCVTILFVFSFIVTFAQGNIYKKTNTQEVFYKVNDVSELTTQDTIIIVNEEAKKGMGLQKTNNRDAVNIEIDSTQFSITPTKEVSRFELTRKGELFLIKDIENNGYLYPASTTEEYLKVQNKILWDNSVSISISNGNANIFFSEVQDRVCRYIRYKVDSKFFTVRTKDKKSLVQIYKKVREYKTEPLTIGSIGYATMYYGEENMMVPNNVTAYTFRVIDNVLKVSKEYLSGEVIPKGTAVVLKGASAVLNVEKTILEGERDENNMLKGTDERKMTEGEGLFYKLTTKNGEKPGFYFANSNGEAFVNEAHKAYLVIPNSINLLSGYDFENTQNAIENIEISTQSNDIYNLQGMKIDAKNIKKGLYIQNNKKIVIK